MGRRRRLAWYNVGRVDGAFPGEQEKRRADEQTKESRQWALQASQRLYIADNSALANGIGGPNPTLTAQAVATMISERIVGRYFAE